MSSATPGLGPHVECENIIIKRRRKRLLPPEPSSCSVTVEPCIRAPLNFVLSDEARPIDLPPVDDEGIREACPLPGDILTPEGSAGENSLIHSDFGSHSESALPVPTSSIPEHGGQPITVHEFLQDMTRSKAGRKYGRRNRLGTVKLDAYYDHSEQCLRSPTAPPSTSSCHIETQTRNDCDQRISAYPQGRVHSEHLSRQVPHLRRKKRFAKSLAQRLFEADVFSSGTSSLSTGVTPDQNPAHTSSRRRPLQFITSLNLTPSMESRIYGKKKQPRFGKARTSSSSGCSADSEIQPVSQADDYVPDSLQDDDSDCPGPAVATSGGKLLSSRNWNGATTMRKRTRARASTAVMRGSGRKRACRTPHDDGKQSSAQVPHNPFEYVPLPLVRVETTSKIRRTGATVRKPQFCTGRDRAARKQAHARLSNQFQLMSTDDSHASGPRQRF
ncbi:hypothetical protein F5888DRAFT_1236366 [Russula emetica]|nr:hypothetical protein F5888DRAFT_1236366 [Russula emetica]